MKSGRSYAIKMNHIPNFILDRFTVPLCYKLAVAAFMDTGYEVAHIQEFENFDAVYNAGSIISEAGVQLPSISQGMQSKAIPDKISDSPDCTDFLMVCQKYRKYHLWELYNNRTKLKREVKNMVNRIWMLTVSKIGMLVVISVLILIMAITTGSAIDTVPLPE